MPDCGVHYLWFAFVCFFSSVTPPPPLANALDQQKQAYKGHGTAHWSVLWLYDVVPHVLLRRTVLALAGTVLVHLRGLSNLACVDAV